MTVREADFDMAREQSTETTRVDLYPNEEPSLRRQKIIIDLLGLQSPAPHSEREYQAVIEEVYNDTLGIPIDELQEGLSLLKQVSYERLAEITAEAEKTLRGKVGQYEGNAAHFSFPSGRKHLIRILTHGVQASFLRSCQLVASPDWQSLVQSPQYLQAVGFVRNLGYLRYFDLASSLWYLSADDAIGVLINHHDNLLKLIADPSLQDNSSLEGFDDAHAFTLLRILTMEPKQKAEMILSIAGVNELPLTRLTVDAITDFYEAGLTTHAHFSAVSRLYLFATGYASVMTQFAGRDNEERSFRKPFLENWRSVIPTSFIPDFVIEKNNTLNKKGFIAGQWRDQVRKQSLSEIEAGERFATVFGLQRVWDVLQFFDATRDSQNNRVLFNSFIETVLVDPNEADARCGKFFTLKNEKVEATAKYIDFIVEKRPTAPELTGLFTEQNLKRLSKARSEELVRHKVQFSSEDMGIALHDRYFRSHPEAQAKLKKFKHESEDDFWRALIPDATEFWQTNHYLLARVLETGMVLEDFSRFRTLINNPSTREIFESPEVDCMKLREIFEAIGVKATNIFYTSLDSLNSIKSEVSERGASNFYKQVLGKKPRLFNAMVSSLHEVVRDEGQLVTMLNSPVIVNRLFMAAEQFGNVTPSIITHYVVEYDEEKSDLFLERAQEFKRRVHQNLPLNPLMITKADSLFLAELICVVFPGLTSKEVYDVFLVLRDRCQDLEGMVIRQEGYEGAVTATTKEPVIKPDASLDGEVLGILTRIFSDQQPTGYIDRGGDRTLAIEAAKVLLRTSGAVSHKEWLTSKDEKLDNFVAIVRKALGDKLEQFTNVFTLDITQIDTVDTLLSKARELFGVYYKDNAAEAIYSFLCTLPEIERSNILQLVTDKRVSLIKKNLTLATLTSEHEFDQLAIKIAEELRVEKLSLKSVAHLIAMIVEERFFVGDQGLRRRIQRELGKIVFQETTGRIVDLSALFKAYITKNIASYFAKSVAGICTDTDTELFNRRDHFHVNMVAHEAVVGNIQGYSITIGGKKSFLFRGFNPASSFVNRGNCEVVCEQMLDVVSQITRDNGYTEFYIPEQSAWHELSNRVGEGVAEYFISRFCREENEVPFWFSITSGVEINKVYKVSV